MTFLLGSDGYPDKEKFRGEDCGTHGFEGGQLYDRKSKISDQNYLKYKEKDRGLRAGD